MTNQYPSTFIEQYPIKLAVLIDCAYGLNSFALTPQFMENFPANSDVFLFYPSSEPGMNRRLERIEIHNHGVFFFPTSDDGIDVNIAYLLGQINHVYNAFIIIVDQCSIYEDICQHLVDSNEELRDHIQVRSFQRVHEFEQFLKEVKRIQNENEHKKVKEDHKITLHYSKKHLFHACPLETKLDSTILYRFGELLHHLDTEHHGVQYKYCDECQQIIDNHEDNQQGQFEEHLRDQHWNRDGFHLTIR